MQQQHIVYSIQKKIKVAQFPTSILNNNNVNNNISATDYQTEQKSYGFSFRFAQYKIHSDMY